MSSIESLSSPISCHRISIRSNVDIAEHFVSCDSIPMNDRLEMDFGHNEIDHGTSDDYYTPPFIFEGIGLEYDMDVCSPPNGSPWIPAKRFLSVIEDGLATDWIGRVWMNPPYSKPTPWIDKWLNHGNGMGLVRLWRPPYSIRPQL